ncbi:MAG: nicotinate-nucleotide--dimethylbenzimidazole phosphoribosyltransferase [Ectothiorhodospiraceae bacterium]|nr:nicotinate-nucleotide--dimethylbenzimidazole phosphoribosyltransferase [Ectothiorhodospiraceae bacterium]MBN4053006.1 nicotinate-nucleotide--dimethylbenzimidazole phosphoribosyltransferase [Gammaproteobacteria bacterium AH-315-K14]
MINSEWLKVPAAPLDTASQTAAEARQAVLTKPPGALGRLESIAIRLAAMQKKEKPTLERVRIVVFAADHGIAEEGISAFPQAVTAEMVRNFANGGAAISVAARELQAELEVINLGTVVDTGPLANVSDQKLGPGTANFAKQAAMTEQQLAQAMNIGRQSAERAFTKGMDLFIGGEMGIGNTSAATALACILTDVSVEDLTGPGTGLDVAGVSHKVAVIKAALDLHKSHINSPITALQYFGGFEIAALTGAYIACAQMGVPVLVDGFIASAAALVATQQCPDVANWLFYAHASAEPGHKHIVKTLQAEPLLDLGMRLGEGSGAAIAVPLLRMACALHTGMATFAEAEVSGNL